MSCFIELGGSLTLIMKRLSLSLKANDLDDDGSALRVRGEEGLGQAEFSRSVLMNSWPITIIYLS